jgi:heme/copper-type cytochrome/quinol oxidase subunit 2
MFILEEISTSTVLYVAIGVLFAVILILLASIVIIYYRKTKNPEREAKPPQTAQNRYFQFQIFVVVIFSIFL